MMVGRSLYWGASPAENVEALGLLTMWCLSLPGARLGVSLSDVATLIGDIYASSGQAPSPDTQRLLSRFGADLRAAAVWPADALIWQEHLDTLLGWLRQAKQSTDFVWIDSEDADWWLTATLQSLMSYSRLFGAPNVSSRDIFRLMGRHDCTVFAPFDGAATWDLLSRYVATFEPDRRKRYIDYLNDQMLDRARLAAIGDTYWSWHLMNFANADDSLICTPMLAVWSEWPSSARWAPPSLRSVTKQRQLNRYEIAYLLDDSYWQRIETLFARARTACGLGVAEPEFAEIESRPPVFFFAAPVDPPLKPEEYAESLRPAIMPMVKQCLISSDPLANHVAWALLEGDLVALRREVAVARRSYEPRYLLLPASSKSAAARPIEDDINAIADRLTFLEFTIGHEARDVYTDIEPLTVRASIWSGTLDLVNAVTGEAIDLLPSAHKSDLVRINDRLAAVHLVLRHLQGRIETATSDTAQVVSKYEGYLDSTDDYFRRRATDSSVPHVTTPNLREAIQDAYPYHYLKQMIESLNTGMSQLSSEVERISASLKTILDLSDRSIRRLSSGLSGIGSGIIALLAILIGLAQLLGAQASATGNPPAASSNNIIDRFFQSPELITATRILFVVVVLALLVTAFAYGLVWSAQGRRKRRHKFIEQVQRFRALVDTASVYRVRARETGQADAWSQLDQLDDDAVQMLSDLWKELRQSLDASGNRTNLDMRKIGPPTVQEWESHARLLEYSVELFDLAPRMIVLPRALCVLRFKSTDFHSRTAISDWDFSSSLRRVGISTAEVEALVAWLSNLNNLQQIRDWEVSTFAQMLKDRGVTAIPDKRTPERWQGALSEKAATQ